MHGRIFSYAVLKTELSGGVHLWLRYIIGMFYLGPVLQMLHKEHVHTAQQNHTQNSKTK